MTSPRHLQRSHPQTRVHSTTSRKRQLCRIQRAGRDRMEVIISQDRTIHILRIRTRTDHPRLCRPPQRAPKSQKPASQLHQAGAIRGCQRSALNFPRARILPQLQLRQRLPRRQRQAQARCSRIPIPSAQLSSRARKMQRNATQPIRHRQAPHLRRDTPRSCRALYEDYPRVVAQILPPRLLEVEGLSRGRL